MSAVNEGVDYAVEPDERLRAGYCVGIEGVQVQILHVVEDQCRPDVLPLPAGLDVANRQTLHVAAVETICRERPEHSRFRVLFGDLRHIEITHPVLAAL